MMESFSNLHAVHTVNRQTFKDQYRKITPEMKNIIQYVLALL